MPVRCPGWVKDLIRIWDRISRSRSPLWALKIASAARPPVTVAIAMRVLSASHAPADEMNCRLE